MPEPSACERYHRARPDLTYLASYHDAEARIKRGEDQVCCPVCRLWIWESLWLPGELEWKRPFLLEGKVVGYRIASIQERAQEMPR